jgi:hypothetical protein
MNIKNKQQNTTTKTITTPVINQRNISARKQSPSWVKGGVIGFLVSLPLWLVNISLVESSSLGALFGCNFHRSWFLFPESYTCEGAKRLSVLFVSFLLYFLIGSLIGWMVGKVRNKTTMPISDEDAEKLEKLLDALEDNDGV